jgi:hypothetical protein
MSAEYSFPPNDTTADSGNVDFLETSVWPEVTPAFSKKFGEYWEIVDVFKFQLGSEDVMNYTFTEQMNGVSYKKLDAAYREANAQVEGDYAYMLTFQGAPVVAGALRNTGVNPDVGIPDPTRSVGPISGPAIVSMQSTVSMTCHFPDPQELLFTGSRTGLYALSKWDGTNSWWSSTSHDYPVLFDPKFRMAARRVPIAKFDVAYKDIKSYTGSQLPAGGVGYYVRVATGDTLQDATSI